MRRTLLALLFVVAAPAAAEMSMVAAPPDPFDYSYCGGKPVYPVIGVNFSTYCGPRNQIAVGRRGKLMWLFPEADQGRVRARGVRQLTEEELARITLLAEVASLAGTPTAGVAAVRYELGIDFSGRPDTRVQGAWVADGSSAMALAQTLRQMVPDAPLLPDCTETPARFSPTLLPADRSAAGFTGHAHP